MLTSILDSTSCAIALERLDTFARFLGFKYCACWILHSSSRPASAVTTLSTFPHGWQQHYEASRYAQVDPSLTYGAHNRGLIRWSAGLFSSTPALWRDLCAFRLDCGCTQAVPGSSGDVCVLSLVRIGRRVSEDDILELSAPVLLAAHAMYLLVSRHLRGHCGVGSATLLSRREMEILRLAAQGRTSRQIANMICVAECTVNYHIQRAMRKLGAKTRTEATIRASALQPP